MNAFLSTLTLKGKLILGAAALLLIVAVVGGIYWKGKRAGENVVGVAKEAGASAQREGDQRVTIERTEQGNAARTEIEQGIRRDDGRDAAVYAQCVRTARTPANCVRFLPERQAVER